MKIFVLQCPGQKMPNCYYKAVSAEVVKTMFFADGFDPEAVSRYRDDPSFSVRELTMELLMELTPDDFLITEETGF